MSWVHSFLFFFETKEGKQQIVLKLDEGAARFVKSFLAKIKKKKSKKQYHHFSFFSVFFLFPCFFPAVFYELIDVVFIERLCDLTSGIWLSLVNISRVLQIFLSLI